MVNDDIPSSVQRRWTTTGPGTVPADVLREAAALLAARRAIHDEQDRLELNLDELRGVAQRAGNRGEVATVAELGPAGIATIERYVTTARNLEARIEEIRRAGFKGQP